MTLPDRRVPGNAPARPQGLNFAEAVPNPALAGFNFLTPVLGKTECCKRRHAAIKLGEQRWGQPCFSAPTDLIGDGEKPLGPELLVCAVARLLFRSPVVDTALFPAFVTSFELRFSNGG